MLNWCKLLYNIPNCNSVFCLSTLGSDTITLRCPIVCKIQLHNKPIIPAPMMRILEPISRSCNLSNPWIMHEIGSQRRAENYIINLHFQFITFELKFNSCKPWSRDTLSGTLVTWETWILQYSAQPPSRPIIPRAFCSPPSLQKLVWFFLHGIHIPQLL